jgi:hypothetical protein
MAHRKPDRRNQPRDWRVVERDAGSLRSARRGRASAAGSFGESDSERLARYTDRDCPGRIHRGTNARVRHGSLTRSARGWARGTWNEERQTRSIEGSWSPDHRKLCDARGRIPISRIARRSRRRRTSNRPRLLARRPNRRRQSSRRSNNHRRPHHIHRHRHRPSHNHGG